MMAIFVIRGWALMTKHIKISAAAVLMTFGLSVAAFAQSYSDRAWAMPGAILVIDSYEGNAIDWAKLAGDKSVKAVIHRAYHGTRPDGKYVARVAETKKHNLLAGLYLLGKPGDPIKQADLLIAAGRTTGVTMLALDVENMDPKLSMTLADAEKFITYVKEKTGRYPLFYTNFSTYAHISRTYGANSVFAKTPLWVARFKSKHGLNNPTVWRDYTFWQFQSEINCKPNQTCFRRVAGTKSDMDVNVFRGSEADLKALFGG